MCGQANEFITMHQNELKTEKFLELARVHQTVEFEAVSMSNKLYHNNINLLKNYHE